jgi:DNA-directed RNA polymerase subunit E'/Rpb7
MEHTALFEERVNLTARDLRAQITNIDDLILQKLSTRLEGKCSRHGFVLPGTFKILSRSMGYVEKGRFTGDIIFHLQAEGRVLNPPAGILTEGIVTKKNKMGMYVSYNDAIRMILPRDLHIGDDAFEAVEIGQTVKVEIQKSRFQVNDPYILSVGLFKGLAVASNAAIAPAAAIASNAAIAPAAAAAEVEVASEEEEEVASEAEAEAEAITA